MSTILDAIHKAEKQRHSDAVPSLEAMVNARRRSPKRRGVGWAIGLLLIGLLLGMGYLKRDQAPEVWNQITQRGQSVVARVERAVKRLLPGAKSDLNTSNSATTGAAANITNQASVPATEQENTLSEAHRELLSQIKFTVISYSKNDDKRFAMIDNTVLREGDRLEGFEITRIQSDGVVIEVQGKAVLIRP